MNPNTGSPYQLFAMIIRGRIKPGMVFPDFLLEMRTIKKKKIREVRPYKKANELYKAI
jgi:hypothetical protein